MAVQTICPRCGARDSFMKGFLPETCMCRVCQSQLDWREIPGCGPDCRAVETPADEAGGGTSSPGEDPTGGPRPSEDPTGDPGRTAGPDADA
jgi:hypothetical protein